jgi:uncharacterized 2Fe-2S/4Fe-4S cluster protein (DUF4445 family)
VPTCRFNDDVLQIAIGKTLFDHADHGEGIRVPTSCDRNGSCHECIVRVEHGMEALGERTDAERFLSDEYRLACQAVVERDDVDIKLETLKRNPKILVTHEKIDAQLNPLTKRVGDGVFRGDERIDDYHDGIYGLAIDIGTTTVVAQLIDLETGDMEQSVAFPNPQIFGGNNVLHRINYDTEDGNKELQSILISQLDGEIHRMGKHQQIYEAVISANPTMRDIFFGLPVDTLGQKPFRSLTEHEWRDGQRETTAITVAPYEVKLTMNKRGLVYGAPLVASHVGGDTTAGILTTRLFESERPSMLIDMGTNTEVVIGNRDRLIAASCPAGPAFEGAGLKSGMPGLEGAIESFKFDGNGGAEFGVIGDVEPRGICGSGVVDMMAELIRTERADSLGRFTNGDEEYVLPGDINIGMTRDDLSKLAQAKAANSAGQYILLRKFGVEWDDLEHIYFSGGFANYLNVANAQAIGMIPPVDPSVVVKVGNTSLSGAARMLIDHELRKTMEGIVSEVEHVELERESDFFNIYVEGCMLEPMPLQMT